MLKISFRYLKNQLLYDFFFKNLKMSTFCPHLKHDWSSVWTFFQPIPVTFSWASEANWPLFCNHNDLLRCLSYCLTPPKSYDPPTPQLKIQNSNIFFFIYLNLSSLVSNWGSAYQEFIKRIKDTPSVVVGWVEWYAGGWDG